MEETSQAQFVLDGVFKMMTFDERADALEAYWGSLPFYEQYGIVKAFIEKRTAKTDPSK